MNDSEYARDSFDEFDDDEYYDQENDMKYVLTAYLTVLLLVPLSGNRIVDTIRYLLIVADCVYLVRKCNDQICFQ